jgi:hypothetical protein
MDGHGVVEVLQGGHLRFTPRGDARLDVRGDPQSPSCQSRVSPRGRRRFGWNWPSHSLVGACAYHRAALAARGGAGR